MAVAPPDEMAPTVDDMSLKAADLSQIKTMLTYCVRGERFSEGFWGEMIERGYILRLLERLDELWIKSG
jgi:hypothetical protein